MRPSRLPARRYVKGSELSEATPSRSTLSEIASAALAFFGTRTTRLVSVTASPSPSSGRSRRAPSCRQVLARERDARRPCAPLAPRGSVRCGRARDDLDRRRSAPELSPVQSVAVKLSTCAPSCASDGVQREHAAGESEAPAGRLAAPKLTLSPSASLAESGIESGRPGGDAAVGRVGEHGRRAGRRVEHADHDGLAGLVAVRVAWRGT